MTPGAAGEPILDHEGKKMRVSKNIWYATCTKEQFLILE